MFVLSQVVQIVLWYLDSGCSRHMTGDRARLINFVEKFIGTVRFGNDEYAAIVGYGDYKLGDTIISRVYYVEGLKHNLFSVGQFCDGGLEVAFRQHSCHIRNYDMVDLLKGSRTTNLYSISLNDMMSASPVCLLTKASSTKSWLWHRRLNHLNFGTLNELARKNLVRGLPMLKYDKDHLCPSCQLEFHWSKDETPQVIEKFIVKTQRALNATVRFVRTDNGTEFVNKTLDGWFESVGISHETSVPRSPQQNGVVERRNRTLMEAARTMLMHCKSSTVLWSEAVAPADIRVIDLLVHSFTERLLKNCRSERHLIYKYFRVLRSLSILPRTTIRWIERQFKPFQASHLTNDFFPNSTNSNILLYMSGRSLSALVKDPEHQGVPPYKETSRNVVQWFDDDEAVPIPLVVPTTPVNVPAAPAPEIANGLPSTIVISEGGPAVTENLLPHQSSPAITCASGSGNMASHFAPSQAKAGGGNTGPVSRASGSSGLKCFNCGEPGHRQSECKKAGKRHLFANPKGGDDAAYEEYEEAPVYDEELECEEEFVSGDVGVNLVVRCSCLTPKADGDDWLKHNIFQSTCTISGKVCTFVCDSDSCDNLIAAEAVQKLGLKTENHPNPYKLQWLKEGDECDVVPIDACHLLLGRPWEYDRDITHNGRTNTYSFLFEGLNITLMPNKPKEVVSKPTGTLLTVSQFEDELEIGDDVIVLIENEVVEDSEILEAMNPLLEEFSDVFPDELPDGFTPLRDIQHHIDLEPGSLLRNMPHYRISPREHEELRRQVEELVSKGHVRESMSPCVVPALLNPKKDGT
ncbi:putative nucleotidyltransferase, ribonuclease H [Tanacetum coccineum]